MKRMPTNIESCDKCPFSTYFYSMGDDNMDYILCKLTNERIYRYGVIHSACPLPDYKRGPTHHIQLDGSRSWGLKIVERENDES